MSDYDFTFDLSMKYTQADFDSITDEEFEKTTEVFLYNRKGEEFHFIKPKVGKWLDNKWLGEKCSVCSWELHYINFGQFKYCPNCGAKMERSK